MNFVSSIQEALSFKHKQTDSIQFNCEICGVLVTKQYRLLKQNLLCRNCQHNETMIEKYNCKSKATSKLLYEELPLYIDSEDVFHTVKSTYRNIQLIEFICPSCNIVYQKELRNCKSFPIYCKLHTFQNTCVFSFGTTYPSKCEKIYLTMKNTQISLYGGTGFSSSIIKEKVQKTCLEKYGNANYNNSIQIFQTRKKLYGSVCKNYYVFNNLTFDSSWELSVYIYCMDNNIAVIREPCCFQYIYNTHIYNYYPDFLLPCGYVEIKGDQFFDKKGNFINPYDRSKDELYQAKYKCMLDNNVTILKGQDIKVFEKYIEFTYGKNYIKQFLVKNS